MVDARTLLRAAKSGSKPSSLELGSKWAQPVGAPKEAIRCTACGLTVRHASLWSVHTASATHRSRVSHIESREVSGEHREGNGTPDVSSTFTDEGGPDVGAETSGQGVKRKPAQDFRQEPDHKRSRTSLSSYSSPPVPPSATTAPAGDSTSSEPLQDFSAELAAFEREVLSPAPRGDDASKSNFEYTRSIVVAPQMVGDHTEEQEGYGEPDAEEQEARSTAQRVRDEKLETYERDEEETRVQAEGLQR